MTLEKIVIEIRKEMESHSNNENQSYMEAYMKNKFLFWGVKSPERKKVVRSIWPLVKKLNLDDAMKLVFILWDQPEREAQYIAMDFLHRFLKKLDFDFLPHIEKLILKKSWWDTVDFLSARVIGHLLLNNEVITEKKAEEWIESGNLWLMRTSLLFQMFYKDKTDFELMKNIIRRLKNEQNFFIKKGIGWILRQYSKTNREAVAQFLKETSGLSNLSIREASKYL